MRDRGARWMGQAVGWGVRRAIDLAMYGSGWSGRQVRARWRRRRPPSFPGVADQEVRERRVHPLFWLGLLLLAALALLTPFVSLGAITLLVMLLRPVAVFAMLLGVILRR